MLQPSAASIETKQSWRVACGVLAVMTMAYGAAWITPVALKDIAAEAGGRSVPSFATALVWLGAGAGGIMMGRVAERVGTRATTIFGALMIALGLGVSVLGLPWPLRIGHGALIGFIGVGSISAPLYVYVSRWFDRRRGSALALISSGSYLAGAAWPPVFERVLAYAGWRGTMLIYAVLAVAVIVPIASWLFSAPPEPPRPSPGHELHAQDGRVLGWPPNLVFAMICAASVLCCVTMSMPQQHLVAFCSDLGLTRSFGALMLSVLLGTAFISRQVWGAIADRYGGLLTVLTGSLWQITAMTGFLFTQDEVGLITVSAVFGLGFSGIIPAYVVTLRELYPATQAYWRIPTLLMFTAIGMGSGGWLAGLLYDHFGYYAPAFAAGVGSNALNLVIVGALVARMLWLRGDGALARV